MHEALFGVNYEKKNFLEGAACRPLLFSLCEAGIALHMEENSPQNQHTLDQAAHEEKVPANPLEKDCFEGGLNVHPIGGLNADNCDNQGNISLPLLFG